MKRRNGFTIVEMLVVIAILAVLMTIVTTAASAAIRKARRSRADAMANAIQAGISTYNAQFDEWPGTLEDWAKNGEVSGNGQDKKIGTLNDSEYDEVMQKMLDKSKAGAPIMDFSSLLAGPKSAGNGRQNGLDFKTWLSRHKAGGKKLPGGMQNKNQITFGYAGEGDGKFYRFKITYNVDSDHVSVSRR